MREKRPIHYVIAANYRIAALEAEKRLLGPWNRNTHSGPGKGGFEIRALSTESCIIGAITTVHSYEVTEGYEKGSRCGALMSRIREKLVPIFKCAKCGKDTDIADNNAYDTVCPDCCEDHAYSHNTCVGWSQCDHCGDDAPDDYYEESGL